MLSWSAGPRNDSPLLLDQHLAQRATAFHDVIVDIARPFLLRSRLVRQVNEILCGGTTQFPYTLLGVLSGDILRPGV